MAVVFLVKRLAVSWSKIFFLYLLLYHFIHWSTTVSILMMPFITSFLLSFECEQSLNVKLLLEDNNKLGVTINVQVDVFLEGVGGLEIFKNGRPFSFLVAFSSGHFRSRRG